MASCTLSISAKEFTPRGVLTTEHPQPLARHCCAPYLPAMYYTPLPAAVAATAPVSDDGALIDLDSFCLLYGLPTPASSCEFLFKDDEATIIGSLLREIDNNDSPPPPLPVVPTLVSVPPGFTRPGCRPPFVYPPTMEAAATTTTKSHVGHHSPTRVSPPSSGNFYRKRGGHKKASDSPAFATCKLPAHVGSKR